MNEGKYNKNCFNVGRVPLTKTLIILAIVYLITDKSIIYSKHFYKLNTILPDSSLNS